MSHFAVRDGSTDPWVRAQVKAFTGWINSQLNEVAIKEQSFGSDLANGVILLRLIQHMETEAKSRGAEVINAVKFHNQPRHRYHFIENFQLIIKFLMQQGMQLINQDAHALSDESRNLKSMLGLVWKLIQKYSLADAGNIRRASTINLNVAEAKEGSGGYETDQDAYKLPPHARKSSTSTVISGDSTMFWLNSTIMRCPESSGFRVKDFNSLADGMAFVYLINALKPGTLDLNVISTMDSKATLHSAFEAAQRDLGIPALLDAELFSSGTRDPQSIMTYLSLFRQYEAKLKEHEEQEEEARRQKAEEDARKEAEARAHAEAAEAARIAADKERADESQRAAEEEALRVEQEAQEEALRAALEQLAIQRAEEEKRRQAEEEERARKEQAQEAQKEAERLKQEQEEKAAQDLLQKEKEKKQQEQEEQSKYLRPQGLNDSAAGNYEAALVALRQPAKFNHYIEVIQQNMAMVIRKPILLQFAPSHGPMGSFLLTERDPNTNQPIGAEPLALPLDWITDIVRGNQSHVFKSYIAISNNVTPANCLTLIAEETLEDDEKEISRVYLEADSALEITNLIKRLQIMISAYGRSLNVPDAAAAVGTYSVTIPSTAAQKAKATRVKESQAQEEVIKILKKGMVFQRYWFDENQQGHKASVFVFYHEEDATGVGGICWCEVGDKHVNPDNYLPLKLISAIYCGKKQPVLKSVIAAESADDRCFSIICKKKTVGINEVHLEASSKANLQLWLKGLTTLLAKGGKTVKEEIQKSLEKMYKGRPFICYEDKGAGIVIPREVFVFYTAPTATAVLKGELGSINWCPQGQLAVISGCSMQLDHITDIYVGKAARVFQHESAAKTAPETCCSIVSRHKSLHIQAESKDMMMSWVAGINHLLAASGKKIKQDQDKNRVVDSDDLMSSPVYQATADGDLAALQATLKNTPSQKELDFSLFKAVVDLQARKVCALLTAGANPSAIDAGQSSLHRVLMFAALSDLAAMELVIRLLVAKGIDLNLKDDEGKTVVQYLDALDPSRATVVKAAFTEKRTYEQIQTSVMMERRPSFSRRLSLSAAP